jgi:imidazole glycerol-phosphate synthase subunit HisH
MKLVIIDYGMGNIKSITSAFKYLNVNDITISNKYSEIKSADKLILPGVGSFAKAVEKINKLDLQKILDEIVLENKKPVLGICLGMQLLCNSSEENSSEENSSINGFGYIDAECKRFNIQELKVPHVGFNQVRVNNNSKLYDGFSEENDFYFTHSYRVQSNTSINQSICIYGEEFISSYEVGNIAGTQFHPELSQTNGLKLLKNFLEKF